VLNANGSLKDADEIEWRHDPEDEAPKLLVQVSMASIYRQFFANVMARKAADEQNSATTGFPVQPLQGRYPQNRITIKCGQHGNFNSEHQLRS